MIIYLNGQYIEEKEAALSPFDHGYLYGIGAFETFRLYSGRPFLPDAHVARLNRALRDLQIAYEVNKQELLDMLDSLLLLNDIEDGKPRVSGLTSPPASAIRDLLPRLMKSRLSFVSSTGSIRKPCLFKKKASFSLSGEIRLKDLFG